MITCPIRPSSGVDAMLRYARANLLLLLLVLVLGSTKAKSSKQDDATSELEYNITNPYYSGCLKEKVKDWTKPRVCSTRSERDPPNAASLGLCSEPEFDYLEIRIASGNWDSATALGWLTQIILSEMLGVPSSMESGSFGTSRDFYDPEAKVDYDSSVSGEPLREATDLHDGDCRSLTATSSDDYTPCAHFMPEFWGSPDDLIVEEKVEPPQGTGVLGLETWFITKFTADEHPEVATYNGLMKPENREKIARIFKRPTTWKDYCELVSDDNCTTSDDVAQRAPLDDTEAERMFLEDLYTGHFRDTEKGNCTLYPSNCTGHIANYPCGWSSNMEAYIYHSNIPLDGNNGPNGEPNGYTASQQIEMWHAANATRSHLMMMWWTPEPLYQHYLGTDAEMQRVALKPYTGPCAIARAKYRDECSGNLTERVGPPEVACDNPVEPLRKLINSGLYEVLNSPEIPEAARNPAYDMLRLFQINDIQLGELFDLLESEQTPRDAVCTWAANNMEFLNSTIPFSYPRITEEEANSAFGYVAMAFGIGSTLFILFVSFLVYRNRLKTAIQFAQLDFLSILLSGSLLVCLGSILLSLPASNGTCLASVWFVHLGYTLELVPLIVKVAAINRMMEAAREMRRFSIQRGDLYRAVAFIGAFLVVYLAVWTGVDPVQQTPEFSMTDATTDQGESVVGISYYCSGGDSSAWQFVAVAWNVVLLLCASVLAFQTRNVLQAFNESRTLCFLIYSHFVFVLLRLSTYLLSDSLAGSSLNYMRSLLYALDQVGAAVIYFVPKLMAGDEQQGRRTFGVLPSPPHSLQVVRNSNNSSDPSNSGFFCTGQYSDRNLKVQKPKAQQEGPDTESSGGEKSLTTTTESSNLSHTNGSSALSNTNRGGILQNNNGISGTEKDTTELSVSFKL